MTNRIIERERQTGRQTDRRTKIVRDIEGDDRDR